MKPLRSLRTTAGNTLLTTIVITGIIGLALVSYLTLTTNQNQVIFRSQVWNTAMPVAEAGIEEAMTHGNINYPTNMVSNDWMASSNGFRKNNVVGDGGLAGPGKRWGQLRQDNGYWDATITSNTPYSFTITSSGFFAMAGSGGYVSRTVQVMTTNSSVWAASMVFKDKVEMNGNNVLTDSYDSTDPNKSTLGRYDPLKAGDNGDLACLNGVKNSYSVGNANIWGRAITGAIGTMWVGPNGAVGSVGWQRGGNSGIQPGWWISDMNITLPDVKAPFPAAVPPFAGTIGTNFYGYIMWSGNYMCPKLDANTLVIGNAVLYVTTDIKFSPSQSLTVMPGASLKIYCGSSGAVFGIIDNRNTNPAAFMYLGLNANKTVDVMGQTFTGCFYAPYAVFTLNGNAQICGSIVAGSGKLNGNAAIHFDESLRAQQPRRGFVAYSWNEI